MNRSVFARTLTTSAAGALLAGLAGAQIQQPGQPASDWAELSSEIPTVVAEATNVPGYMQDRSGTWPLRYGEVVPVSAGINTHGRWDDVAEDGSLVWRLRISSPGAYTIALVFDEYNLVPGGELFLYDENKTEVLGAFTEQNNKPNGQLGTVDIIGDTVIVEYVQQPWVTANPSIHVGEVVHDYLDLRDPGLWYVGGCGLIDINCPTGAGYQTVKRAVVRTQAGGALCSASILNNTAQDGTPFLLTANHCGNMTNGIFRFKYERTGCGTGSAPTNMNLSGATLLDASAGLGPGQDSQLYRLTQSIPASYDPYYAGWDRATSTGSPVATVGHGNGAPKQVAVDNSGATLNGQAWQVFWHAGYLEGGNSGGPLFNGQNRVIGPACCVSNFVCGSQTAYFGRFDRFWTTDNLGQHLDPIGADPQSIDGFDPTGTTNPVTITSITPGTIPSLIPGTVQTMNINGSGFTLFSTVFVDGTQIQGIPSPYTFVNPTLITFDMPEVNSLGNINISVTEGINTATGTVTVTTPATPTLQVGNGDIAVNIFSFAGIPVISAGDAGALHLTVFSRTNVPSVSPTVTLGLGNGFTNVPYLNPVVIDPTKGWSMKTLTPASVPGLTTFYFQEIDLTTGSIPLDVSNLQEIFIVF